MSLRSSGGGRPSGSRFSLLLLAPIPATAQDVPDVLYTPHEQHYGAHHVSGKLLVEGTSFETGATDALDGGWYWSEVRSPARYTLAGEAADLLTTCEPPRVVDDVGPPHGGRCLELSIRNGSAYTLLSRPFRTADGEQATVPHAMRLWVRGDETVPAADRAYFTARLETFPQGANVSPEILTTAPDLWTEKGTTVQLAPGTWYRLKLRFGSKVDTSDVNLPDQTLRVDAFAVGTTADVPA